MWCVFRWFYHSRVTRHQGADERAESQLNRIVEWTDNVIHSIGLVNVFTNDISS